MAKKKAFVLRLNEETYRALERWAADEFRSVNGQLEYIIHQALVKAGRLKKGGKTDSPGKKKEDGTE
ncbi:MAG: Arc family DNA-binding protein [Chlorobi bacterium]|nr:Arc family DNA-binding protein [Chlorobiota bacterium]